MENPSQWSCTEAVVSLVLESMYQEYCPGRQLQECKTRLSTYSGESLSVLGMLEVEVQYEGQSVWLDLKRIYQVQGSSPHDVLYSHQGVFGEELGMLKGYEAKIHIDAGATPRFCCAQPVPYAMDLMEFLIQGSVLGPLQ